MVSYVIFYSSHDIWCYLMLSCSFPDFLCYLYNFESLAADKWLCCILFWKSCFSDWPQVTIINNIHFENLGNKLNKLFAIKQYLQSKKNRRLYRAIQSHTCPDRTPLGNTGPCGTIWNQMGNKQAQYGSIRDLRGPYGAIQGHTGP